MGNGAALGNERLELEILKQLFVNSDVKDKIFDKLEPDFFEFGEDDKTNSSYFQALKDYHEDYKTFPDIDTFGNYVKTSKEQLKSIHNDVAKLNIGDCESPDSLDAIEKWMRRQLLYRKNAELAQIIQEKRIADIPKLASELVVASYFSLDGDAGFNPLSDESSAEIYKSIVTRHDKVPCGIESMDKMMDGGWSKKSLSGVLLGTHKGKTMFLCNSCANAIRKGFKALYVSLEEGLESISARIIKNLIERSKTDIRIMSLKDFQELLHPAIAGKENKLRILELPESGTTPGELLSKIKTFINSHQFVPDIIFVDYVGKMEPNGRKAGSQKHERLADVTVQIRDISRTDLDNHPPIVTAWQYNKEGSKIQTGELTEMGFSYAQAHTADIIWAGVGLDPDEEGNENLLKLKLAKGRECGENALGECVVLVCKKEHQRVLDQDEFKDLEYLNRNKKKEPEAEKVRESDDSDKPANSKKGWADL